MIIEAILYTGETEAVDKLFNRYKERLDNHINIDVHTDYGNHNMIIGTLSKVKRNQEHTILYGEVELHLDKYKDSKITNLETRIKGEDFVRKFPIE